MTNECRMRKLLRLKKYVPIIYIVEPFSETKHPFNTRNQSWSAACGWAALMGEMRSEREVMLRVVLLVI